MTPQSWILLSIFVCTIVGIIFELRPMSVMALMALGSSVVLGVLPVQVALNGFGNQVVWLIVFSFFVSKGIIKSGLGKRVAYYFLQSMGSSPLVIFYGLALTDLILAPFIPSNTARAGGILFPIFESINKTLGSSPKDESRHKIGAFLAVSLYQADLVISGMFMTAMAANPLIGDLALKGGANLDWMTWAKCLVPPGLLILIGLPYLIRKLVPAELEETQSIKLEAAKLLENMGSFSQKELITVLVLFLLIFLWIFGGRWGIAPVTTSLIGVCLLLLFKVISRDDFLHEGAAWDTLIWFGILVMLAGQLNEVGVISWIADKVWALFPQNLGPLLTSSLLAMFFVFIHYFFASSTAHVAAMYSITLALGIKAGLSPLPWALTLAAFSNLSGCLTHYGSTTSSFFFGPGYVSVPTWWRVGFILSLFYLVIFLIAAPLWWRVLGIY